VMLLVVYFSLSFFTSYILGNNTLFSNLFSGILSLRSSLNVREKVSHPHKTTNQIILLYILIHLFWDNKREDKMFWTE
jgi:hypothetical protein